ncbi:MAG: 30S ribosome-binding factor RbfA [Bifidobacteriaceae bacterium]|jgi:ribosome-binding factor A|nr:30S ribosome-binding factor RbfA [Bifidobacteriaceae bacterium]
MADPNRARRLADRIREIVAGMLGSRIKDPRLGFVTVTDVRVTGDLQHATVFYTVLGDAADRAGTAAALRSARGIIRSEVGHRTGLRLTPSLEFQLDAVPEGANEIEDAVRAARERDAQLAAAARGATYAGDPDPYRKPSDDEAEPEPEAPDVGTSPGFGAPGPQSVPSVPSVPGPGPAAAYQA